MLLSPTKVVATGYANPMQAADTTPQPAAKKRHAHPCDFVYVFGMKVLPQDYERLRLDAGIGRYTAIGLLLGVWLVPGSLASLETYAMAQLTGRDIAFWRPLAAQGLPWLVYGSLSPLILHAAARLPLHRSPRLPKLLVHIGFALGFGIPYAAAATVSYRAFMPLIRPVGFLEMLLPWYLSALPVMLLTYFAVIGAANAVHWFVRHRESELKSARLETQLSEARLGALRMQLHPHFLFNSLNAVTVLVRDKDHVTAERMLELLGDVLRATLRAGGEHRVPLDTELALIRSYLAIEEIRFSDRLRIHYRIDGKVNQALVPALVLQPLVENAIRHGISRSSSAGRIEVVARKQDDRLILEVIDDGPGPNVDCQRLAGGEREVIAPGRQQSGVGLANTRDRLRMLYHDASCELSAPVSGGTIARIDIPLEWSPRASPDTVHA